MKYQVISIVLFAILLSGITSCSKYSCSNSYISNYLLDYSIENEYDYCNLFNKAKEGDDQFIEEFVLLSFYDGLAYEHGAVILELIDILGEEEFIESLNSINVKEKKLIQGYIMVGLNFTQNPKFKEKKLNVIFPSVHNFLLNKAELD